ncbi:MAG TPA: polyribonucleotide nucleotidyltransferase [Oscillospiraceae bacterium]|nr:polyribonucleotide nucleotidyltransferase [Oscillospiraceae bacterium]HNW03763.1 polyribonucleotide nucleotidyltransferase [Oscillospiraceae bacterium]
MFENYRVFETEFAGRKMTFETGKLCALAGASVLVRYGETVVLCNATASATPRDGIDYFPLSVDFDEKLYSIGHIPGSFPRREGRPTDRAMLDSRVIDRPMRPLFPKDMRNDCSVVMSALSVDPDNPYAICGMNGASMATAISDIPWNGPIAGCEVGLVDGEIVLNPTAEQSAASDLHLTVSSTAEKVVMIEAAANEVDNETMLKAILTAHKENQKMVAFISGVVAEIGKPKFTFQSIEVPAEMFEAVKEFAMEDVRQALCTTDKKERDANLAPVTAAVHEKFDAVYPDSAAKLDEAMYKLQKYVVRRWLLDEGKRADGRALDEIRPLDAEVGLLPRTHGSGLFSRGQTQVLSIATLGLVSDAQELDGIDGVTGKRYIHQYNMPSYTVGETRPSRGPGRREIGHGALAEKALEPVIPSVDEFPYTIRVVSEVLSSNGSTSQGAVCGSTLALMDAGVPIKKPVAGISCGLVTEDGRWMTMVDIQGLEDFFGDMDFKVAGTKDGITAIQMDLKCDGLTEDIIREALEKTYKARCHIIDDVMLKAIPAPREELSKYAPKMLIVIIDPEKIRDVIGSGGKVIQKICAECDVKIDVEEDGHVYVSGVDIENARRAVQVIETITKDPEIGAIYKGKVTRLMQFGAFVEIAPGKEGLCHISKLDNKRVEKVEDVVKPGDEVVVKVVEIDSQGRINLSRKDALADIEAKQKRAEN